MATLPTAIVEGDPAHTAHHDALHAAYNTLTTAGDLPVATGAQAWTRLGVEANGQILTADSAQAAKMGWKTPAVLDARLGGARFDGSTDDAAAIQSVIDGSTVGDVIEFPKGTGLVGAMPKFRAGRHYRGVERTGCILKQADGVNGLAVACSYDWYNNNTNVGGPLEIDHLTFDVNSAHNTTSHGVILMNWDSYVHDVIIHDFVVDGVRCTTLNRAGTSISDNAVNNRIERCFARCLFDQGVGVGADATGSGFRMHDPSGNKLTDGFIRDCFVASGTTGIVIDAGAGWVVDGNHVYSQLTNGIRVEKCWDTRITDNFVENFGREKNSGNSYTAISAVVYGAVSPGPAGQPTIVSGNQTYSRSDGVGAYRGIEVFALANSFAAQASVYGNTVYGNSISPNEYGYVFEYDTAAALNLTLGVNQVAGCSVPYYYQGAGIVLQPSHSGPLDFHEVAAPAAPGADTGRLYVKDNGSGKSQLCVIFATGAVQILATEP